MIHFLLLRFECFCSNVPVKIINAEQMKCIVKVLHSGCHISMQNLSQIRYILSAKYGLLEEDEVIEPYNVYLKDMNVAERRQWAVPSRFFRNFILTVW